MGKSTALYLLHPHMELDPLACPQLHQPALHVGEWVGRLAAQPVHQHMQRHLQHALLPAHCHAHHRCHRCSHSCLRGPQLHIHQQHCILTGCSWLYIAPLHAKKHSTALAHKPAAVVSSWRVQHCCFVSAIIYWRHLQCSGRYVDKRLRGTQPQGVTSFQALLRHVPGQMLVLPARSTRVTLRKPVSAQAAGHSGASSCGYVSELCTRLAAVTTQETCVLSDATYRERQIATFLRPFETKCMRKSTRLRTSSI